MSGTPGKDAGLVAAVNAAPFVPGSGAKSDKSAASSPFLVDAVKASPFVPNNGRFSPAPCTPSGRHAAGSPAPPPAPTSSSRHPGRGPGAMGGRGSGGPAKGAGPSGGGGSRHGPAGGSSMHYEGGMVGGPVRGVGGRGGGGGAAGSGGGGGGGVGGGWVGGEVGGTGNMNTGGGNIASHNWSVRHASPQRYPSSGGGGHIGYSPMMPDNTSGMLFGGGGGPGFGGVVFGSFGLVGGGGVGVSGVGGSSGRHYLPTSRSHEAHLLGRGRGTMQLQYMTDSLRRHMAQRQYILQAQWSGDEAQAAAAAAGCSSNITALPEKIQHFHTLCPLDEVGASGDLSDQPSVALGGLRTLLLKGISGHDGQAYALRRIDGKQVIPSSDLLTAGREAVDAWSVVSQHPNLVGLRSVVVSSEGDGGNALVFVHDHHPCSVTLAQAHLVPSPNAAGCVALHPPSEDQLWSYLTQLTAAMRAVHSASLALHPGCLHPSKVLLTGFGRLRVSSIGIPDALGGDLSLRDDLRQLHRHDLSALGGLLLSLGCCGLSAVPSLDVLAQHFSADLSRLVAALLASAEGGPLASVRQLVVALADRAFSELDAANMMADTLVSELSKECENGRLLRVLIKLNFINGRPEGSGVDAQWSETGDRYLLKLFQDFVFHQEAEEGGPLTDWAHVVETLNKVDAGVLEKVMLLSRDEQSMLVVSFADVKRCVEAAYAELIGKPASSVGGQHGRAG